ncbi:MAG: hypothetical protein ACKO3W_15225, partial [bacterium]
MRGRLLVVGSSPSVEQFIGVAQSCIGAVSRATNLFDAIADISHSSDREPIAAVAISSECPEFEPAIVIQAIQAVDRSVPVFLLYPRGEEMSAIAIREGYEHTIPLPAIDEDVREAFAPVGLVGSTRDAHAPRTLPQHPVELDISVTERPGTVVDTEIRRALASAHPESPMHALGAHGKAVHDDAPHASRHADGGQVRASDDHQPRRRETPGTRGTKPEEANPRDDGHPSRSPQPSPVVRASEHTHAQPRGMERGIEPRGGNRGENTDEEHDDESEVHGDIALV